MAAGLFTSDQRSVREFDQEPYDTFSMLWCTVSIEDRYFQC